MSIKRLIAAAAVSLALGVPEAQALQQSGHYKKDAKTVKEWADIDARPVPAWWQDAKFGIFIIVGVAIFPVD